MGHDLLRCIAFMLPALPASAQEAIAPSAYVRPESPGQLIEVSEGRRLHILCKGPDAGPTVMFEAGVSQYTANSTFGGVQEIVAEFAQVCTYDRAGLGWSDPAPTGWTPDGMVEDLHSLLAAAEVEAPLILVGHSLGGLLARAYIGKYPMQIAGLVLLDSTTQRDLPDLVAARAAIVPQIDAALSSSRPGVPVIGMPAGTSSEVVMAFTPEILRGVQVEFEAIDQLIAELGQPGALAIPSDLPLTIVSRGKIATPPTGLDVAHREGQEALRSLSTNSRLIIAEKSGHAISLDEPEIVIEAIRDMFGDEQP